METKLVIGADFGSDSVRAIVVNAITGETKGEAVCAYPRWAEGKYCEPENYQFRQHPLDYLESFEKCVKQAVLECGPNAGEHVYAISVDTTGSTPCPVNREGIPLALLDEFHENPNAMFHLWKDHTAIKEAQEINDRLSNFNGIDYLKFQGTYSSEWWWAKILHTSRVDPRVKEAAWSWVEHSDWIPAVLTHHTDPLTMYRCSCAAGHKALWNSEFNGLPSTDCLSSIDPYLGVVARRYGSGPQNAGTCLGPISKEWADKLGISEKAVVGGSSFDAHAGAVGAGIKPTTLVKVVGTSTVDMLIEKYDNLKGKNLKQLCGQAEDSIIPGYVGIEASQAAFGDIFAWLRKTLMWPTHNILNHTSLITDEQKEKLTEELQEKMISTLEKNIHSVPKVSNIVALDWFNGRRYPNINETLQSGIYGLKLGTEAPDIFEALSMAACFGSKTIFDSLVSAGIEIKEIIAVGGIARKSSYSMQLMADVLNRPIHISAATQACARGAAIYASVAAGIYSSIPEAQVHICEDYITDYYPREEYVAAYAKTYEKFLKFGNFVEFSGQQ